MIYLLDTNVLVQHLRMRSQPSFLSTRLATISPADVAVCSIVRAELLAGAHHGRDPANELPRVQQLLALFSSLPFDDLSADHYGVVCAAMEKAGNRIGSNDLMIASIALANQLILVTHNGAEFGRVPGIRIEDWQTP